MQGSGEDKKQAKKNTQKFRNSRNNMKITIQEFTDKLEENREMAKYLQTLLDETEQINDHLLRKHMNKQEPKPSTRQENLPRPKPTKNKEEGDRWF